MKPSVQSLTRLPTCRNHVFSPPLKARANRGECATAKKEVNLSARNDTILLADDDTNDIWLFRRALKQAQIPNPVQSVRDGAEAMDYLSGRDRYADRDTYPLPALLVLDVKMPRRTGFEVLQWLREQPSLKRLLVVMLSSSNQVSDVNRAYELGANSYLVKPARFDGLLAVVRILEAYWLMLTEKPQVGCG
jgi:CheY-like chemotaxis protein